MAQKAVYAYDIQKQWKFSEKNLLLYKKNMFRQYVQSSFSLYGEGLFP